MGKRKPEHNGLRKWATSKLLAILGTVVTALALGGWQVHAFITEELASRDDLIVVSVKADRALDNQIKQLIVDLQTLEAKKRKDTYDLDRIRFLREELERLQQIRRGK